MFPTKNILAIASTMAMLSQTTLAAPGVLTARNGCYKAGLSWAAAGLTDDTWITTACNLFVGSFANGQTKYQCYQPPNDNDRIDLSISGNGILALQDCISAYTIEFHGCATGSEQEHNGWHYKLDPNTGGC